MGSKKPGGAYAFLGSDGPGVVTAAAREPRPMLHMCRCLQPGCYGLHCNLMIMMMTTRLCRWHRTAYVKRSLCMSSYLEIWHVASMRVLPSSHARPVVHAPQRCCVTDCSGLVSVTFKGLQALTSNWLFKLRTASACAVSPTGGTASSTWTIQRELSGETITTITLDPPPAPTPFITAFSQWVSGVCKVNSAVWVDHVTVCRNTSLPLCITLSSTSP